MKNINRTALVISLMSLLIAVVTNDIFSKKGSHMILDFTSLYSHLKHEMNFKLTAYGEEYKSFLTGKKYVHYETVVYYSPEDYQIIYHTEGDITLKHGKKTYIVSYRKMRTQLTSAYSREYSAEDLENPDNKQEDYLKTLLLKNKTENLHLKEYGLKKGDRYYASFKEESYMLPPGPNDGEPKEMVNRTLIVSDEKLPNDRELTPLYQGWTY